MTLFCRPFAVSTLALLFGATAIAGAQQAEPVHAEPGTSSPQVTPASAAPQAQTQPNLRTDSMPHTNQDASTDSGPLPETLGMDVTPLMDMGWDWSVSWGSNEPSMLKRIVTSKKGQVSVVDVQTVAVTPLPVTNPLLPPTLQILGIPQPPVRLKPPPQDPLTGIAQ